ncbi:MAG TPA: rod shape-determining protein MreC [Streptosporangiaceae bacterium]|nr:rod shape-determining protein MreC [Streptosporangiaceae bacterium]
MRDTRRTRGILVVLLVVALGLIALNYADGSNGVLRAARNVGSAVFGGVEHAASSVAGLFSSSGSSGSQVQSLQQQVTRLRAELTGEQLSRSDYAELHKLLQIAGAAQYRVVAATVIAIGTGFQQTVTIDAGSADGIRPDETVLNGEGLVGAVTSVTTSTATVLLASSSAVAVGAQVSPSGQIGVVTGAGKAASGGSLMHLQMLSSAAVLKPGDQLVTSASVKDRPYVPGVPIGVITKLINVNGALTEAALVRPYVDYTGLGIVGVVIVPPRHNPRFAALPPLPHPAPTVTVTVTAKPRPARRGSSPTPRPGG